MLLSLAIIGVFMEEYRMVSSAHSLTFLGILSPMSFMYVNHGLRMVLEESPGCTLYC